MRTTILKKMSILAIAALMIVTLVSGLSFGTAAVDPLTKGAYTLGTSSDVANIGISNFGVWGFNGRDITNASNPNSTKYDIVDWTTKTDSDDTSDYFALTYQNNPANVTTGTLFIDLSERYNRANNNSLWLLSSNAVALTVGIAASDAHADKNNRSNFYYQQVTMDAYSGTGATLTYTFNVADGTTQDFILAVYVYTVSRYEPAIALAHDAEFGNYAMTSFLGYTFTMQATGTAVYAYGKDKAATYGSTKITSSTPLTGNVGSMAFRDALKAEVVFENTASFKGLQVLVSADDAIDVLEDNQVYGTKFTTASGSFLPKLVLKKDESALYGRTYAIDVLFTNTTPEDTLWSDGDGLYREKWAAIAADLGTTLSESANGIATLRVDDYSFDTAKSLNQKMAAWSYVYTPANMANKVATLVINCFTDTLQNDIFDTMTLSFSDKGNIIAKQSFAITRNNETFVIKLKDNTFLFFKVIVKTNLDYVTPLSKSDIDLYFNRSDAEVLVSFDNQNPTVNKTILVDTIFAGIGQVETYYNAKNALVAAKYNDLVKLLIYRGMNTDESRPCYASSTAGWASKFYSTGDIDVTGLYGNSGLVLFSYVVGDESITLPGYNYVPNQTFNLTYDGNTYYYSLFYISQKADLKVNAAGTGVYQKMQVVSVDGGTYYYSIRNQGSDTTTASKALFKGISNPTTGYAVDATIGRTATAGKIVLKGYNNARDLNGEAVSDYNATGAVVAFRFPAGTKLTFTNENGVDVMDYTYGNVGIDSADGLIDYLVSLSYRTYGTSTVTMRVTYANGIYKDFVIQTSFVNVTNADTLKAYNAYTADMPTTLEAVIAEQPANPDPPASNENPIESIPASSETSSDVEAPNMGNAFNAIAYIVTFGAASIGGISTMIIRKKK